MPSLVQIPKKVGNFFQLAFGAALFIVNFK
jgi:hypothetical protein